MSTNNELIILKNDKHKRKPFEVHENFCVDNEFEASGSTILERFETLIDAISFANDYCNEWPGVEYGYHIDESCLNKKELKK